jgi:LDH2 family malate/lactate/ureidoglycolate dehydrogenase
MCVALIGGMDRLERHYTEEAEKMGIDLRGFTRQEANIGSKIRNVDAMLIFTNKVSHKAKAHAIKEAKANGISVHMWHSCGVYTLRNCLDCLMTMNSGGKIDA